MKKLTVDNITYSHDEQADVMYISFYPGEKATSSVLLTDHILLRLNYSERRAIGITLLDLSLVIQDTGFGPRSFPLTGLADLEPEWQAMVIEMIKSPPVSEVLKISTFSPTYQDKIPIAWVDIQVREAA